MLIILSIHSKNLSSLTNFLKFIYKLKTNKILKLQFITTQSPQKNKKFFFSVLRSPHVNKKSQEQFEYYLYKKQLKIQVLKLVKFFKIWKLIKTKLFYDIKIETKFICINKSLKHILFAKINSDKVLFKASQNKNLHYSNITDKFLLRLFDIQGEVLLKLFSTRLDSSVGRAKD